MSPAKNEMPLVASENEIVVLLIEQVECKSWYWSNQVEVRLIAIYLLSTIHGGNVYWIHASRSRPSFKIFRHSSFPVIVIFLSFSSSLSYPLSPCHPCSLCTPVIVLKCRTADYRIALLSRSFLLTAGNSIFAIRTLYDYNKQQK